ncbi:MAG: TIGR04282 family arsenosugar biosynthesis glycosyltransferase [Candidatus Binataceae bacterium]
MPLTPARTLPHYRDSKTATTRPTLIVFAREPTPGETKTRLIPRVGAANAAALADAFTRDALTKAHDLGERVVIAAAAPNGVANSRYFRALARQFHAAGVIEQGTGNLGVRMARVVAPYCAGGAILIGTDTPSLPRKMLACSLELLRRVPVVLGPSLDGGYYLVGVRGPLPDIFRGIRWGGGRVLEQTLKRLRRDHIPYRLAPSWYDVDRWSDLMLLIEHLRRDAARRIRAEVPHPDTPPCPATARVLARLGLLRPDR